MKNLPSSGDDSCEIVNPEEPRGLFSNGIRDLPIDSLIGIYRPDLHNAGIRRDVFRDRRQVFALLVARGSVGRATE